MPDRSPIYLIDGSSFLYRAYYSLRPLHTMEGKPVQAVYSFCRMMGKLIKQFKPEHMVLVWDSKGPTERKQIYADYKATRQAPPSDLFEQKNTIQEFAELIKLPQLSEPGVEADDLIASLALQYAQQGHNVVIFSSDKDLYQLLDGGIRIFDPFKDTFVSREEFEQKIGFSIDKLSFYYALVGDTSDNIPGVAGIGDKSATELCQEFASLDHLYQNLDKVKKERIRKALEVQKDNAFLSLQLFTLRIRPVDLSFAATAFNEQTWSAAYDFFKRLNFSSLLPKNDAQVIKTAADGSLAVPLHTKDYAMIAITDQEQLEQVIAELEQHKLFAIDTETNGLGHDHCDLVGLSFCVKEGTAYYIPVGHSTGEQQLSREYVLNKMKHFFESAEYSSVMQNAKFDIEVLQQYDVQTKNLVMDTMIAANLVVPDWQRVGLKHLSEHFFGEMMISYADAVTKKGRKSFAEVPIAEATPYAAADAHQTFKLYKVLLPELEKRQVQQLYTTIEQQTCLVLATMEENGILCDADILHELGKSAAQELYTLDVEIHQYVGMMPGAMNLNSPKQIGDLLFNKLQLPPQKKSAKKTGYSTDAEVLEALAPIHPIVSLIIRYRELAKLKSTYIDALPDYISSRDGRIHTSYSQVNTATGRLASLDPNLQNIPVQAQEPSIRSAFKPAEGYKFLSADYSQIELRVLAFLSQDEALLTAFRQGRDIHQETAARLFEVPFDQVTHDQRQLGKRINFSILYGLTPYGLSKDLHISLSDAKKYIDRYFSQYPQVAAWMEQVVEKTKKLGYVTTNWGRRRYVPQIHEKNKNLYEHGCRIAINTVAQGTAAEIMKLGMINVQRELQKLQSKARLILQIHDELLLEVPIGELESISNLVKNTLESVVNWDIALKVTIRSGSNWHEVTK